MKGMSLFSTHGKRERLRQAALAAQRSSAAIAVFEASQLAKQAADAKAAARSPAERARAQGRSDAERQKSTPAV